jgi:biopolymer transport protein ExbD
MKKCSKSHHHALAELNITPLLDLAFVLLVIFIITTTPVVNDLQVDLPTAAKREKTPKPKVNYVTIDNHGDLYLNKEKTDLVTMRDQVIAWREKDPDLNIVIRGAAKAKYRAIVAVMDMLQQANIAKVNLATDATPEPAAAKDK